VDPTKKSRNFPGIKGFDSPILKNESESIKLFRFQNHWNSMHK